MMSAYQPLLQSHYERFRVQALRLAQVANEGADTDRLRAVLLSLLGRCYHATGDLAAAQYHYAQVGTCASSCLCTIPNA